MENQETPAKKTGRNPREIGVFWTRQDKDGNKYLKGHLTLGGLKIPIFVFPCKGETESSPNYQMVTADNWEVPQKKETASSL